MSSVSASPEIRERESERLERVKELARAGMPALGQLIDELTDANWTVRRAVVAALAAAEPAAMPILFESLRSSRGNEATIAG
ncbi:MAG TPA: hypothetical protein VGC79_12810, partial [Polyangiaceae bacterium]